MRFYNGDPRNITAPLVRNIVACSSGSGGQILVQTSVAHLFGANDTVTVAGVAGTTEANGTWVIQVIDSTKFLLLASVFANAYTSGGTATDLSLTPFFGMPDDGEPGTAQSVEASIQNLADKIAFVAPWVSALDQFVITSTSTTSFKGPKFARWMHIRMCGGGGGGGAGGVRGAGSDTSLRTSGGGGGGGAMPVEYVIPNVPGRQYDALCGFGGGGAVVGQAYGGNGNTSSLLDTVSSAFYQAIGGQGGASPDKSSSDVDIGYVTLGGSPILRSNRSNNDATNIPRSYFFDWVQRLGLIPNLVPQNGGFGTTNNMAQYAGADGNESPYGYAGGNRGTTGGAAGGYQGGGPGGGGGAGPFGDGGDGGPGAVGNETPAPGVTITLSGNAAANNSGAGGGGGGAMSGGATGSTTVGGSGGDGGSGKIIITFLR